MLKQKGALEILPTVQAGPKNEMAVKQRPCLAKNSQQIIAHLGVTTFGGFMATRTCDLITLTSMLAFVQMRRSCTVNAVGDSVFLQQDGYCSFTFEGRQSNNEDRCLAETFKVQCLGCYSRL
jgi:hypothetical protein